MAREVHGWRQFSVDRYDEDGTATRDGVRVLGRFWRVVRCDQEWGDGYTSYREARAECNRAQRLEIEVWALLPHEREAAIQNHDHPLHAMARLLRSLFPDHFNRGRG